MEADSMSEVIIVTLPVKHIWCASVSTNNLTSRIQNEGEISNLSYPLHPSNNKNPLLVKHTVAKSIHIKSLKQADNNNMAMSYCKLCYNQQYQCIFLSLSF